MEVEEEFENVENKRKLDEQRNRLQKELPDVEKLSFIPQEIQRGLKEGMQQQQLQDIEHKRHALLPKHQKNAEDIPKDTEGIREGTCRKKMLPHEKRCGSSKRMSSRKRSVSVFLSNKVENNERPEAGVEAQLQSLRAAEERRGSNASQGVNCYINLDGVGEQLGILGAEKTMYHFELLRGTLHRMFDAQTPPSQMLGKEEEEQRNPATGGSDGLPATPCVGLVRLPDARSEGGASGNLKTPGFRKRSMSQSTGGKRKAMEDGSNL